MLIVHADNCVGENKNKFMLAMLSHVVHLEWFDTAAIRFMVPGHTHCDIDSEVFATFSRFYSDHDCMTPFEGMVVMEMEAFTNTNQPHVVFVNQACDWKSYYAPHIASIKGHTAPHDFVIGSDNFDIDHDNKEEAEASFGFDLDEDGGGEEEQEGENGDGHGGAEHPGNNKDDSEKKAGEIEQRGGDDKKTNKTEKVVAWEKKRTMRGKSLTTIPSWSWAERR